MHFTVIVLLSEPEANYEPLVRKALSLPERYDFYKYKIFHKWDGFEKDPGLNEPKEKIEERRIARLMDICGDCETYAVITPDGEWLGKDGEGFEAAEGKPSTWDEAIGRILRKFPNCMAVWVDCHA
jgi:hypothetical protein